MKKYDICGLGNPLMDFLIKVEDLHISELELKKGVSHLLDEDHAERILEKFTEYKIVPAGGATNTLMGIAALGGKCVLLGVVGAGRVGDMYEEIVSKQGVVSRLVRSEDKRTGKAISLVTPDAERTFGVHLGAAISMETGHVFEEELSKSAYLYFTGYELEAVKDTVFHAVDLAIKHKVKIAFDVADPELVNREKENIMKLLPDTDLLFMNETESLALTGKEPEFAVKSFPEIEILVVKTGASGSIVRHRGKIHTISSKKVLAVDTTGAGDLYAAGFLYSIIHGKGPEEAGRTGSLMGAKVVSQVGALLSEEAKQEIRDILED